MPLTGSFGPFRYPHDRAAIREAEKIGQAAADALREERDRALEDYVSSIGVDPRIGETETATSSNLVTSTPNCTQTVTVDDGVFTVFTKSTVTGTGLGGTVLTSISGSSVTPPAVSGVVAATGVGYSGSVTVRGPGDLTALAQTGSVTGTITSVVLDTYVTRIA